LNHTGPPCRRALLLPLLLLPLLASCRGRPTISEDTDPPFVFRSLDLRQQDRGGKPAWELTSPEARYDARRRVIRAVQPRGVIYQKGQPVYRLQALSGTVLNDGEVILLEGTVRLRRVGSDPIQISAARVRWLPRQQRMELDRRPSAVNRRSRLLASKARFRFDEDRLELRGKPQLEHWTRPFDPFKALPKDPPEAVLTVAKADWYPGSGRLVATGPVQGRRDTEPGKSRRPTQTLTASALQGNTQKQDYLLKAPVEVKDVKLKAVLKAGDTSIQAARQTIRTRRCDIRRPGETLRADTCTWNWKTNEVEAIGSMEYRRRENDQITRGERMKGRLSDKGWVQVTSPGGRVFSRFRVPQRSRPSSPPSRRQAPEPIRL
jgi:LPS export ABC transporter protein LptC